MLNYLLGTANGGTVSKAALFDLDGREIAVASRKVESLAPQTGWSERDAEKIWEATAGAIKEVMENSGVAPGDVACVACSGHGNGLYLVDKAGVPVRNAIYSTDNRARKYVDEWLEKGLGVAMRPKTMQSIWPAQPNAILRWLKDNEPDVMERAAWVLMCKDYIRFRLNGVIQAELTDMSGTSLLNVGTGEYDVDVLEAFGLADIRDMLPPLVGTADVCGSVTAQAAAETGLNEGTPVAGGMFDIDACGLASGMTDESRLCMIVGTWGNNQYISKTPVADEDVFMTSCYSIPGYYLMLEGSATSATNLEWFVTQFFQEEEAKAKQQGKSVYDLCNELVGSTKPDESKIVFLPFLYGSNANPDAKSCFVGLDAWHTRAHVLRAIYEGVVFGHMTHVDRLRKFRDMPGSIQLTGGAARSEVWVQIFADCFQVPVETPDATELGALGAAIAGSVAVGCHAGYDEAVEAMVHFSGRQDPDPETKDVYAAKYRRYKKVIAALDPIWKELA